MMGATTISCRAGSASAPTFEVMDLLKDLSVSTRCGTTYGLPPFCAQTREAVSDAARRTLGYCAAARVSVDADGGDARLLRVNVCKEGGVYAADAVYTFSPNMPDGPDHLETLMREMAGGARE